MTVFARRVLLSTILIAVAVIALIIAISTSTIAPQSHQAPAQVMTVDPDVVMNLTRIPQATPLSDEDAAPYVVLREQIEACDDYDDQRRAQTLQHIKWLIDPSDMPADVILAFNTDIQGGLIFGMAGVTSTQWRLLDRPPNSCLIDIGRDLNVLLISSGREPITVYDK